MKNRWMTFLLAVCMSLVLACTGAFADETEKGTDSAGEVLTADESAAVDQTLENAKKASAQMIEKLSEASDEELEDWMLSANSSKKAMAANWLGVRNELGKAAEILSQEASYSEDGRYITVNTLVSYDKVPRKTKVTVANTYDLKTSESTMEWTVDYPKTKLFGEAVLNTIMGIGIVFLVLLFLSFLIRQIHWIPDLLEKRKTEGLQLLPGLQKKPDQAAAVRSAGADELEIAAVIAAAIAAAQEDAAGGLAPSSPDLPDEEVKPNFVVRSIRKVSRNPRF